MKKQISKTKRKLKEIKKHAWIRYTESITQNTTPQQIWSKIKWFTRGKNNTSKTFPQDINWQHNYLRQQYTTLKLIRDHN